MNSTDDVEKDEQNHSYNISVGDEPVEDLLLRVSNNNLFVAILRKKLDGFVE